MTDQVLHHQLADILRQYGKLAIAFSGGVDSTLLAAAAVRCLGRDNVLLINVDSPFNVRHDSDLVRDWAIAEKLPLLQLTVDPLNSTEVAVNPPDRCYHCKKMLMSVICREAATHGFQTVADGFNTYDLSDYRPGAKAADECGIVHPFLEAGMSKDDIRQLSHFYGLPNWNAPADACLASRIPYHTRITKELLEQVSQAENSLNRLGFIGCRVRHYGVEARLELRPEDFSRLADCRESIVSAIRTAGFEKVLLDLQGYRRGALNEALKK